MARAPRMYRRLPGSGGGLAERHKLYLAEDHLLSVVQTGFTERYSRFELRDIQAISARETETWIVYLACWGGLLILNILLAFLFPMPGGRDFFGFMSVVLGLVVVYNLVRGRTCQATLYTAVSTQPLPSLHRLRRFHKVSNLLAPVIESRQGLFDANQLHAVAQPDAQLGPQPVIASAAAAEPAEQGNPGKWVLWLSLALFGDAAATGLLFAVDQPALAVLRLVFMLAITCLIVLGFANIPRVPTTMGLRRAIWATFTYVIYAYGFLYVAFVLSNMDSVLPTNSAFDAVLPSHSPVSYWCNIVSIGLCMVLGAAGLLAVSGARAKR